jgi:hypothetical protein
MACIWLAYPASSGEAVRPKPVRRKERRLLRMCLNLKDFVMCTRENPRTMAGFALQHAPAY